MDTTQAVSQAELVSGLRLERADRRAYAALSAYHYCNGSLPPVCGIWALFETAPTRRQDTPVAGVIVYGYAPNNCAARRAAVGDALDGKSQTERRAWLNRSARRIARVIVAPRYRRLGLATRLARETLPLVGTPLVEAVAAFDGGVSFFEKAGMRAVAVEWDDTQRQIMAMLEDAGLRLNADAQNAEAICQTLANLTADRAAALDKAIRRYLGRFSRRGQRLATLAERVGFTMRHLGRAKRYYYWLDPSRRELLSADDSPAGGLDATGRECL